MKTYYVIQEMEYGKFLQDFDMAGYYFGSRISEATEIRKH